MIWSLIKSSLRLPLREKHYQYKAISGQGEERYYLKVEFLIANYKTR